MNRISRQLLKIANDINQHSAITLHLCYGSSYVIVPWGYEGMDAEQLVTHILRTEKQFKKGFDQLTDYVPGCEYYGLKCYNGQLFAYCRIFPRSIAQGFVEYEAEKPESVDSVQVKNYVQHMLKECFPNIPMKIQDREIGQIVSHAQKLLNNK